MANNQRYQDLRYPNEAIYSTTDYLSINAVTYTPSLKVEPGQVKGALTFGGYEDTPGNRNTLLNRQLASGDISIEPGKTKISERNFKSKITDKTIILPIPSNIQDGTSVKYTEGNLDGLTAQVLGVALGAMESNPNIDIATHIQNVLKGSLDSVLDPATKSYFLRTLATSAANLPFGGNLTASQLLARTSGNILNPNMELLFDGVTLRSFKFSFKMTPRSQPEAEKVKNIIRYFKIKMSPSTNSTNLTGFDNSKSRINDLYLKTPHIFELRYMKGNDPHPFLHKFKPCFLTDMSVNYTGEGTYATYGGTTAEGGGTPVSIIMDLGFKELEPIYANDYDPKDPSVGY